MKPKKSISENILRPTGDEKLKKSISDRKPKRNSDPENKTSKNARFLITVNVIGSCGPIRLVVNEKDKVSSVIDSALRLYAREERLPSLGSDINRFLLYPANAGLNALNPSEAIGSQDQRKFVLSKKEKLPHTAEIRSEMVSRKKGSSWKAWINKSLNFKISSH